MASLRALGLIILALCGSVRADTDATLQKLAALTVGKVGSAGVAARLLETNEALYFNADERFPMASTYKVPIAMTVLARIDRGEISLADMHDVPPEHIVYSSPIAVNFVHPGVALSVANLIEVMITSSDNSATDVLLDLAGGPAAVTAFIESLGISGLRVDRNTADLLKDFYGRPSGLENLAANANFVREHPEEIIAPNPSFESDPRDQASPRAMLDLLTRLAQFKALSPASSEFLLAVMARTHTAPGRIPALLPEGTATQRKTGTIGGVANDIGFITLPDGRHMVLAIYTKGSDTPTVERDRAVAEIARAVYDYFVPEPPGH